MTSSPASGRDLPWSHRQSYPIRMTFSLLAGAAVGVIGTLAHRLGASHNMPYGLVVALLIIVLSAWCARSRAGALGLGVHVAASSMVAWGLAVAPRGSGALTPVGFGDPSTIPFWSEHVGLVWLYGMIVVQVVMLFLPRRMFLITVDDDAEPAATHRDRQSADIPAAGKHRKGGADA